MKWNMDRVAILALSVLAFNTGCNRVARVEAAEASADAVRRDVSVGDSYSTAMDKLGRPNLETVNDRSRVMIYDKVELILTNEIVATVYDHR